MAIEIRRLRPGDERLAIQAVDRLTPADEKDERAPSLLHMQWLLSQATNYLLLAFAGERPVGFLTAYRVPKLRCDASMVYLFEIEVAPPYRRQGSGKAMVNLLKTLCQESNVEEIWVGTENANIAAKRLYESTGAICYLPDNCEFIYQLTFNSYIPQLKLITPLEIYTLLKLISCPHWLIATNYNYLFLIHSTRKNRPFIWKYRHE